MMAFLYQLMQIIKKNAANVTLKIVKNVQEQKIPIDVLNVKIIQFLFITTKFYNHATAHVKRALEINV